MIDISIHHPQVAKVRDLPTCAAIELVAKLGGGGMVALFVDPDMAEWDAIVEAVAAHRAARKAGE